MPAAARVQHFGSNVDHSRLALSRFRATTSTAASSATANPAESGVLLRVKPLVVKRPAVVAHRLGQFVVGNALDSGGLDDVAGQSRCRPDRADRCATPVRSGDPVFSGLPTRLRSSSGRPALRRAAGVLVPYLRGVHGAPAASSAARSCAISPFISASRSRDSAARSVLAISTSRLCVAVGGC